MLYAVVSYLCESGFQRYIRTQSVNRKLNDAAQSAILVKNEGATTGSKVERAAELSMNYECHEEWWEIRHFQVPSFRFTVVYEFETFPRKVSSVVRNGKQFCSRSRCLGVLKVPFYQ